MNSQLKKYKTCLYILHKQLSDTGISKKTLEEQIKRIAGFKDYDSYTLEKLIIVTYLIADEMDFELQEDEQIKFNW